METEIERLRAENEKLKARLIKLKDFFGQRILFYGRAELAAIQGTSEILIDEKEEFFINEEQQLKLLGGINKSAVRLRFIQRMTEDIAVRGIVSEEIKLYPISVIESELLNKSYPQIGTLIEDQNATFESNIACNKRKWGVEVDVEGLDAGLRRIGHNFTKLNPSKPFNIHLYNELLYLRFELSCELPSKGEDHSREWFNRYQNNWVDPVSEMIFELYDGVLRTEIRGNQIVCVLELPLVEMEDADGN